MGGAATPALAAAVADAGALGMVNLVIVPADEVAAALDQLRRGTSGTVGFHVLMPFLDPAVVEAAASRVRAEAGGHVRGQISLLPLLDGVLEAVEVPVLAAGGIATARGLAAVLAAGAAGARVGTRFLALVVLGEFGTRSGTVLARLAATGTTRGDKPFRRCKDFQSGFESLRTPPSALKVLVTGLSAVV
jgi:hypothetical protein